MSQARSFNEFSDELDAIVGAVRSRLRLILIGRALAALLAGGVTWLAFTSLIDMMAPLPVVLRGLASLILWAMVAVAGYFFLWRPLRRFPSRLAVAREIERTVPGLYSGLITTLDVRDGEYTRDSLSAFVRRAAEHTRKLIDQFDERDVAPVQPVLFTAAPAAAAIVLVALLMLLYGVRLPTAMARVLVPFANIRPVSWVSLHAIPGNADVLEGESVQLSCEVRGGILDELTLELRAADGEWVHFPLARGDLSTFTFTLDQLSEDHTYRFRGGNTWTDEFHITMIRRPLLEGVEAAYRLPEFLELPEPRQVHSPMSQIVALGGSRIRLHATVAGDVAAGRIELLRAVNSEEQVDVADEVIWFEDDLPTGARAIGTWRWITDRPYSGRAAHSLSWSGEPYGLSIPLRPLRVPRSANLMVYARIDPAKPPEYISLTVQCEDDLDPFEFVWPVRNPSPITADNAAPLERIAAEDQWVRLEVPCRDIVKRAPKRSKHFRNWRESVPIRTVTFAAPDGMAAFDRMGYVTHRTETVTHTDYDAIQTYGMVQDAATAKWTSQFELTEDGFYRLVFEGPTGQRNPEMKPVPLVVTSDSPPTVLIEQPTGSLTLTEAQPVPVVAHGFDDYGVEAIGIAVGPDPDVLPTTTWLENFSAAETERTVSTSINTLAKGLKPGGSIYFRVYARDYRKQVSHSDAVKITLLSPEQKDAQSAPPPDLTEVEKKLEEAAKEQEKLAEDVKEFLEEINADEKDPKDLAEQLNDEQKQKLDELDDRIRENQQDLADVSDELDDAATKSEQSDLTLQKEDEVLEGIADDVDQQPNDQTDNTQEQLENVKAFNEESEQTGEQLDGAQQQLSDVQEARKQLAEDPQGAQEQMDQAQAQQQAGDMKEQLDWAEQDLDRRIAELDELEKEQVDLQNKTQQTPQDQLGEVGGEQQELDQRTGEALDQTQQALEGTELAADADVKKPEPWQPEGEQQSEPEPQAGEPPAAENQQQGQDGQPEPPAGDQPAGDEQPGEREQLLSHQDEMLEAIRSAKKSLEMAKGKVEEGNEKLEEGMAEADSAQAEEPAQAAEALQEAMTSPEAKTAGEIADALAKQVTQQNEQGNSNTPTPPGPPGPPTPAQASQDTQADGEPQGSIPDPVLDAAMEELGLTARQRASIYRLPPKLREPLVNGMKEKGPEAYQGLIEAYFEQLSEDVQ